jgi:integrase
MAFKDYATAWNETYNLVKTAKTRAVCNNIIYKHIIPAIGGIPINKLFPSDVQKMVNDRSDKRQTCEQIRMGLRQINKSAINDGLIAKDFCYGVKLLGKIKTKKRALTDLEKKAVEKADFTDRERAFVYLILYFGLRRQEALAVCSSDFKNNVLHINKTISFNGNEWEIKETKSQAGVRDLPIPQKVTLFFKNYISALNTLQLITKMDGTLVSLSSYTKMWKTIVRKLNDSVLTDKERELKTQKITGLTAHIFRHNYCTELYYSDISLKEATRLMGHADVKMIMNVYAHLDDKRENTAEKISKIAFL